MVLTAIQYAIVGPDNSSNNIAYKETDSTFGKNLQMIWQVLREPETQNAITKWASLGDLNDVVLRGENHQQVCSGSVYTIVDLFFNITALFISSQFFVALILRNIFNRFYMEGCNCLSLSEGQTSLFMLLR